MVTYVQGCHVALGVAELPSYEACVAICFESMIIWIHKMLTQTFMQSYQTKLTAILPL